MAAKTLASHRTRPTSDSAAPTTNANAPTRQRIAEAPDPQQTADLRAHTQQQRVWGSDRLRAQIEALTQRATTVRPRSRP